EPSFGVPASNVVQLFPLSVDQRMSTFAALILLAVVPATFHVIGCEEPPLYVTAEDCEVTVNGPAVAFTVTTASSELFPEPPGRLSRTVNLKLRFLATDESASTVISCPAVVVAPAKTDCIRGKYRVGEVVGTQLRKFTPVVFVALGAADVVWLSICSQM